jgi:MFS family permease
VKWLGPLLLIGVFARHNLTWLPGYSPAEWFYLLGGLWEVVLCATILLLLPSISTLAIAALWIGILEGAQVTICGALMGHARPPEGMNECDYLTGWHVGAIMTGVYLFIVCMAIGKEWRK